MLEAARLRGGRSPVDVRAIVLTHAHPDHVGFAGERQRDHDIPACVHRADSQRTRQGTTKPTEGSSLAMLGMLRHRHARRAPRHLLSPGAAKQPPVAEVTTFDDGDELDVPGRLQVIHTPADPVLRPRSTVHRLRPRRGRPGPRPPLTPAPKGPPCP